MLQLVIEPISETLRRSDFDKKIQNGVEVGICRHLVLSFIKHLETRIERLRDRQLFEDGFWFRNLNCKQTELKDYQRTLSLNTNAAQHENLCHKIERSAQSWNQFMDQFNEAPIKSYTMKTYEFRDFNKLCVDQYYITGIDSEWLQENGNSGRDDRRFLITCTLSPLRLEPLEDCESTEWSSLKDDFSFGPYSSDHFLVGISGNYHGSYDRKYRFTFCKYAQENERRSFRRKLTPSKDKEWKSWALKLQGSEHIIGVQSKVHWSHWTFWDFDRHFNFTIDYS